MGERPRTGAPARSTPGPAEIVGYGLLATAVAAGVLYLDGQRPRDIAIIAGAILALLATLVLIAPRLGEPEKQDAVAHDGHDDPQTRDHGPHQPGHPPPDERAGTAAPSASTPTAAAETTSPDPAPNTPARSAASGRRAKRGRRRR